MGWSPFRKGHVAGALLAPSERSARPAQMWQMIGVEDEHAALPKYFSTRQASSAVSAASSSCGNAHAGEQTFQMPSGPGLPVSS